MIKPETLWNFLKTCTDTGTVGRVCRALGRQQVELNPGEQLVVEMIQNDSKWMDERISAVKERDRERKRIKRMKAIAESCPPESAESTDSRTSVRPSVHPSNDNTDPIPIRSSRSRSKSEGIAGTEKAPNPWNMTDDDIRYGTDIGTEALLKLAFGKGGWAKVVAQAGDQAARELFITIRNEIKIGESAESPAAAYTARCKRELGVDFSLSLAESVKAGKASGVR